MYCMPNFTFKRELKAAVKEGDIVSIYSPGPFPPEQDGVEYLEGPHYPKPHSWYAKVQVVEGRVVKVLS